MFDFGLIADYTYTANIQLKFMISFLTTLS